MDDYYQLLDVAPDAERDDIKGAYRAKRDVLQAQEGDDTRAKIAQLNRAWNVLSDPAQRERYDDRLAEQRESGEYDDDDDDDGGRPVRARPSKTGGTRAEQRLAARAAARRPSIVLPEGLVLAPSKSRGFALLFDLMVLLLLFTVAQQFIGVKVIDHRFPGQQHEYDALVKKFNAADTVVKADGKTESDADKQASAALKIHDSAAEATAKADSAAAHAKKLKDTKTRDKIKAQSNVILNRLIPTRFVLFGATLLLALAYTVPLTALTGQTLGKRFRKIKVVRLDGSVPGWKTALIRFGVPALVATILWSYLRELALAVVLLGMIGWISNANRQGLHDRLAKTVVVEA